MDWDTLRERYLSTRRDERGPVERFLDLLDYPRATIAATLAPGLERIERERGNIGAFGQGRVSVRDMLGEMGLKPGPARAILGFVGDVALDPLTYAGPAGWGAKVAKGGQAARVGLRGRKALTTGLKDVAKGGVDSVRDVPTRDLFRAVGETTATGLSNKLLGPVSQGRVGKALSRVGGDKATKGGILADFDEFGRVGQQGLEDSAVRQWLQRYGAGQGPGLRIGRDASGKIKVKFGTGQSTGITGGSTVAHIPFTEYGIHVPAFTGEGRAAANQMRIVSSTGRVDPRAALGIGTSAALVGASAKKIEELHNNLVAGTIDPVLGMDEIKVQQKNIEDILKGKMVGDARKGIDPADPQNIGELLSLRRLTEEAESAAAAFGAKATGLTGEAAESASAAAAANLRYADAVRGAAKQFAMSKQAGEIEAVKRMLQIDDDIMGTSLVAPMSAATQGDRDPSIAVDILGRAERGIRQGMRGTFGPPQGLLRNHMRMLRNGLTTGAREVQNATEAHIRDQIVKVLHDSGIEKIDPEMYDAAAQLTYAHMFKLRNDAAPGANVFFPEKFGGTEPAEWLGKIQQAQKSGIIQAANDKLKAIAAENNKILDTLGDEELADEVLGHLLGGESGRYVPTATTPEAQARIRSVQNQAVKRGRESGQAGTPGVAGESFQKKRTMLQYRFLDEAGKPARFFEKDRWVMSMSPEELAAIDDPASVARIQELQQNIAYYDKQAADPVWAAANAPRQTDPWELNELANEGAFKLLVGGDRIESGFADTNIANVMAQRLGAHERAVARRTWLEFAGSKGITIEPASLQGAMKGQTLVLKDGSEAKFFRDEKSGTWGFEHMGQRYRPLQQSVQGLKDNPIIQGMGDTTAKVYHEDIARALEDAAKLYDDEGPLLQTLDKVTGAWKSIQLMHPSWTVGNIVGDTINYLTGGVRPQDMAAKAKDVAYAIRHANDPEALAGRFVTIRGQEIPAEQFVNDLRANRLLGTNAHAETAMQLVARKFFVMPSQLKGAGARGVVSDFMPANLKADFLQRLSHETAASKVGKVAKAAGFVARDRLMRRVVSPWFRANEKVNDYMRALAYASFLEQGNDIASAVNRTVRAGFDYADLSRVERRYFRRMLPFYSWLRLNGAYQLKLMLERPIYVGAYPLLRNAVEEAINGDSNVPLHARPSWMRHQLAMQVGSDPDERTALLLGTGLPQEQAFQIGAGLMGIDGAQDFMHYFLTSLNPAVRTPAEIAGGREFFTDKTIGSDGDVSVPGYLAQQLRPVREMQALRKASEGGVGSIVGRALVGGRLQPMSDERIRVSRLREYQTEETRLRSQIRTAERREDKGASVAARARLLKMYGAMLNEGLDTDVPVWARKRLAELTGA